VSEISKALSGIRGVKAERLVPEIANHLHCRLGQSSDAVCSGSGCSLRNGDPRIEVSQRGPAD
jgi:hypothetical protein